MTAAGIPRECRRLAEVDFPIAEVSKHAAREKSIRHGHPSTLHLWWARRPLASSRAVLLALLLPDPCDPRCPEEFKRRAREFLSPVRQPPKSDAELRRALLWFIGSFANWDMAAHPTYLRVGRNLVRAAHGGDDPPLVVDPFAGGGSIPLEALRLGCEAFASDLNPVACLILKVMLEDIPRHGPGLADELRRVGADIKAAAQEKLADLYPPDPDGATPIAYLWARTARCEAPDCGAEIPLMRSFWLCRKPKRKWALRPTVERPTGAAARSTRGFESASAGNRHDAFPAAPWPAEQPDRASVPCRSEGAQDAPNAAPGTGAPLPASDGTPRVEFEVFQPDADEDVAAGTVSRARAVCLCCGSVLPPERVRAQLSAQRGGADAVFDEAGNRTGGARMTAVVTVRPDEKGRRYRLPTEEDYAAVRRAQERVAALLDDWERGGRQGLCPAPDEPLPRIGTLGFRVQRYGMLEWGHLFTARQKAALNGLVDLMLRTKCSDQERLLACCLSRVAMSDMSCTRWNAVAEKMQHTFGRQALPIVWDFAEVVVTAPGPGNWESAYRLPSDVVDASCSRSAGQVQPADATHHPLPDETVGVWFTDPPYYDAIPYSDLSDFFLVWLKRTLPGHTLLRDPFDPANPLSPKAAEAVQDETKEVDGRPKDRTWFEETMGRAFAEGRRVLRHDGVGAVVFAHKTTEGWEALLSGMIRGGWTVTASWPLATEMGSRLRARDSAALATSIHLVCRPRPEDAPVGDWADVLRELPVRVGDWMERLQGEGVRGADLVFACIGPALEIFSRYSRVETADGAEVALPEYLEKVWEVVGRTALENVLGSEEAKARNGLAGALEEDSRLTALFLWTLQATAPADDGAGKKKRAEAETDENRASAPPGRFGYSLAFDVVRRFAQPLGIDLPKWEKRIVETKKGVVRLLPIAERAKRLFGGSGAEDFADRMEQPGASPQLDLLQAAHLGDRELAAARGGRRSRGTAADRVEADADATTLDRVHVAMLLQRGGRTQALRNLVAAERERGPDFERLANALSALYPRGSEEKRLLDAMLLALPG